MIDYVQVTCKADDKEDMCSDKKAVKWVSEKPEKCDICGQPITSTFIDGRTAQGFWAIMCVACHRLIGVGVGEGKGQIYDVTTLEKLEKR